MLLRSLALADWTQSAGGKWRMVSAWDRLVAAIVGTPILLLAAFHHGDVLFSLVRSSLPRRCLLVYLASTPITVGPIRHEVYSPSNRSRFFFFSGRAAILHSIHAAITARIYYLVINRGTFIIHLLQGLTRRLGGANCIW